MTETTWIQSAHWEAEDRLLVQLQKDWTGGEELPPLFLGPKTRPFAGLEQAPLHDYGRLAHYFIDGGEVVFILDPEDYPQYNLEDEGIFIAGSFNGWSDACGDDYWKLHVERFDEHSLLCRRVPLEIVKGKDSDTPSTHFKFISGDGTWLAVSLSAPNLVHDSRGNANYELRQHQSGRHLFYATIEDDYKRSGKETLIWSDGEHREAVPIPSVLRLLEFSSDARLGAFIESGETVFRLFAPRATRVEVRYYPDVDADRKSLRLSRTGSGLWEGRIEENLHGSLYHYRIHGRNRDGSTHFDPTFPILDPYARAALSCVGPGIIIDEAAVPTVPEEARFTPAKWHDLVILECHLEDLVAKANVKKPDEPARYHHLEAMLRDEHSYLRTLGINAIELQPLQLADKQSPEEYHWGYMTTNFFALESSYAEDPRKASQIEEFGRVVQAAHEAGIAVILDVVYNHVGEPAHLLFIDKYYYFELDNLQNLENWSGCGNDLRCDAPMVRRLIIDSLLYLVRQFDIDGFRFDLAELIGKAVLLDIEAALKKEKPSLILIAEPWSFRGHITQELMDSGYASWNDGYRDFIRDYVRGWGNTEGIRYFIGGSQGTHASWPAQTVNYTESHDDRCWLDGITENEDHNGYNPQEVDRRRTHLMISLLMMSLGIPMLAEGQDFLRSKHGVNNTYQRRDLNVLDYQRLLYYTNTHRYFRDWIQFRRGEWGRLIRLPAFPEPEYLAFYSSEESSALITCYNADHSDGDEQMIYAINPHLDAVEIDCPPLQSGKFRQVADSERVRPEGLKGAILPVGSGPVSLPALSAFLWVL